MAKNEANNSDIAIADRIRSLKLYLHRRLDRLYERLTSPTFTGTIRIEVSAKDGRPGEPKTTIEEYGISDI